MKILCVGHTYIVAENQKKLHALAALPDVELLAVTPPLWREPLLGETRTHFPANARFQFRSVPAVLWGGEQFYWYLSGDLGLRRFQPDILWVEQGAGAVVYAQSLIYRNLFAPLAKAVFFTWWNLPYRARWPLSALEQFNLSQTQGAVVGNADAAAILRDHGYGGPCIILPQLGVDPHEFCRKDARALRQSLGLVNFTVGYVGRFVEEKGVMVLLEALAAADFEFQLLMIGRGPLEDKIRVFAQHNGLADKLKIVSGVNQTDIALYQNCMDAMVVPSLTRPFWKEQFGHVIIEAMACEVPVIGSDSAEVPRVIGEAGVVVPEGDAMALRSELKRLGQSASLRRKLGESGRQRVLQKYTHTEIAHQLSGFFRSLL